MHHITATNFEKWHFPSCTKSDRIVLRHCDPNSTFLYVWCVRGRSGIHWFNPSYHAHSSLELSWIWWWMIFFRREGFPVRRKEGSRRKNSCQMRLEVEIFQIAKFSVFYNFSNYGPFYEALITHFFFRYFNVSTPILPISQCWFIVCLLTVYWLLLLESWMIESWPDSWSSTS